MQQENTSRLEQLLQECNAPFDWLQQECNARFGWLQREMNVRLDHMPAQGNARFGRVDARFNRFYRVGGAVLIAVAVVWAAVCSPGQRRPGGLLPGLGRAPLEGLPLITYREYTPPLRLPPGRALAISPASAPGRGPSPAKNPAGGGNP